MVINRNIAKLFFCQAVASIVIVLVTIITSLATQTITTDKFLITFPYSLQFTGLIVSTSLAGFLMRKFGRRIGFTVGALIVMAGGFLCAFALIKSSFVLFCIGSFLVGGFIAFSMHHRFSAAEMVPSEKRAEAISTIIFAGVIVALGGKTLAVWTKELIADRPFVASYIFIEILGFFSLIFYQFINYSENIAIAASEKIPLKTSILKPAFFVACLGSVIGYITMNMLMTATPLAMDSCGHSFKDTAMVIQWHVVGMYAPALIVGKLINRIGIYNVLFLGIFLMLATVGVNTMGHTVEYFGVALLFCGIAWSFLFVGGTTLLAKTFYLPSQRNVQSFHDTILFTMVAIGSWSSGLILSSYGWNTLNLVVLPVLILTLFIIALFRLKKKNILLG
jgi:MFS family permease